MGNTRGTQGPLDVSTKQQRIAEAARQHPEESLTSLNHYMDMGWMEEAYRRVRKDSAPGYDRQTVEGYGENLQRNLSSLLERAKSGEYFAPPVRRVYIPKGAGNKDTRPIGIPTTEDKVLQRAVLMLLEPIYEQEFHDFSFGFRPGRSAHQALDFLWRQVMSQRIAWILDVDIQKFFDTLDKAKLREIFRSRVQDGVIRRLVSKWLEAGVLEAGSIWYPERGTPQGGVISPLLSNIYLHEVLDKWSVQMVKPRLKGRSFMARFADDCVMGFEYKVDADRVFKVLPKRLGKYGLSLHPAKTRIVFFARPWRDEAGGGMRPGTFDFLGFTHYWGRSQKGNVVLKRKTAQDRFSRGLKWIRAWCRVNRHLSMQEQHKSLCRKLFGHYAYYGITGNGPWLVRFREEVKKTWCFWLNRRSRHRTDVSWERFASLERNHFMLPCARVVHSVYAVKP